MKKCDKLWYEKCFEHYGYLCEVCGGKANQIHHFFPKGSYSILRYEIENGVPLCQVCHFKHHHLGHPSIHAEIINSRGQKWYKKLLKQSKELRLSFKSMDYYKKVEKQLNKL